LPSAAKGEGNKARATRRGQQGEGNKAIR